MVEQVVAFIQIAGIIGFAPVPSVGRSHEVVQLGSIILVLELFGDCAANRILGRQACGSGEYIALLATSLVPFLISSGILGSRTFRERCRLASPSPRLEFSTSVPDSCPGAKLKQHPGSPKPHRSALLHVTYCTVLEGDLHVWIYVDLLGPQIDHALGLSQCRSHLINRLSL
jgi:hypothetical protein